MFSFITDRERGRNIPKTLIATDDVAVGLVCQLTLFSVGINTQGTQNYFMVYEHWGGFKDGERARGGHEDDQRAAAALL